MAANADVKPLWYSICTRFFHEFMTTVMNPGIWNQLRRRKSLVKGIEPSFMYPEMLLPSVLIPRRSGLET